MDQEKQLMDALEWFDEHKALFDDVKLRDWRESFRNVKLWVRFTQAFTSVFLDVLEKGVDVGELEDERDALTRCALVPLLAPEWWPEHVEVEPLAAPRRR